MAEDDKKVMFMVLELGYLVDGDDIFKREIVDSQFQTDPFEQACVRKTVDVDPGDRRRFSQGFEIDAPGMMFRATVLVEFELPEADGLRFAHFDGNDASRRQSGLF